MALLTRFWTDLVMHTQAGAIHMGRHSVHASQKGLRMRSIGVYTPPLYLWCWMLDRLVAVSGPGLEGDIVTLSLHLDVESSRYFCPRGRCP